MTAITYLFIFVGAASLSVNAMRLIDKIDRPHQYRRAGRSC